MTLPNFIVLGGVRCGTSWLSYNLRLHPEIFMHAKKETHFFDRCESIEKDIKNYESLFSNYVNQLAVGDSTPTYLNNAYSKNNIPEMIKSCLPNVKFIINLRNPADRAISGYWHNRSKFPENQKYSFREKMEIAPAFLSEGFYDEHITRYFKYFPRERFHFNFFDDIASKPYDVLKSVYAFLGVDTSFRSPLAETRLNSAHSKKHEGRNFLLYFVHRGFFKLKMYSLASIFEKMNWKEKEKIDGETRRWLVQDIYYEHNLRLQEIVHRDLSNWNRIN